LIELGNHCCKDFEMSAYSADPKAEHLLRLSDEVGRIAGTLARLSAETVSEGPDDSDAVIDPEVVMSVIRARRMRAYFFNGELFADPAWDMLLELFHAALSHRRMAVKHLTAGAAVPATTALRWLTTLVDEGLCSRRDDPLDGRRVYVELTPKGEQSLRRYFAKLNPTPVI
jgi:predicted transcriptional regulator